MKWKKIKNVFSPKENYTWMYSHAANPVPFVLDKKNQIVRIYFTCRDNKNRSYIAYIDVDFKNDYNVINIAQHPVVSPGSLGLFDDSGTAMGCLIEKNSQIYLFYLGWNLKTTVPWLNSIGLATAKSINSEFIKYSLAPIMDRSHEDPFSISYPAILFDNGIYRMWYGSNLSWGTSQNDMQHVIKYAESADLIHWARTNQIHIPLYHKNEYALSKPWVLRRNNQYKMWYSYRANNNISTYRIGYAESSDGLRWKRCDDLVGIEISSSGWDSEMICYPSVFELHDKLFMLYNGNGYGATGFGIAILEN
jgi:hypothetical protein